MRVLGLQNDKAVIDSLFEMMDFDESGVIDMRELQQALQWAFKGRRGKLLSPKQQPSEHQPDSFSNQLYEALVQNSTKVSRRRSR